MNVITKSELPKWLIFILPFDNEEEILSGIIVPFVLFSFMGMIAMCFGACKSWGFLMSLAICIISSTLIFLITEWLIVQIDIIRILRLRLKIHYTNTQNEEERIETKKRLLDLFVKV
jgi:hypothetical protein